MKDEGEGTSSQTLHMRPHQSSFVDSFVAGGEERKRLLVAPPQMGMSNVAIDIAKRLIEDLAARRLLFLVPPAMCAQYAARLKQAGVLLPTEVIHSGKFREFEAAVPPGASPWPAPLVAVMGTQLAKKKGIEESLTATDWDFVVVDGVDELARGLFRAPGITEETLDQPNDLSRDDDGDAGDGDLGEDITDDGLGIQAPDSPRGGESAGGAAASAGGDLGIIAALIGSNRVERALFLSLAPAGSPTLLLASMVPATVWDRSLIAGPDGLPAVKPVDIRSIRFRRSPGEIAIILKVEELARELQLEGGGSLVARNLVLRALSSPVALERTLRSIQARSQSPSMAESPWSGSLDSVWGEGWSSGLVEGSTPAGADRLKDALIAKVDAVAEILRAIDELGEDKKLDSLVELLGDRSGGGGPNRKVCVIATYRDTADYLREGLAARDIEASLGTGSSGGAEEGVVDRFRAEGGVLVATAASLGDR